MNTLPLAYGDSIWRTFLCSRYNPRCVI